MARQEVQDVYNINSTLNQQVLVGADPRKPHHTQVGLKMSQFQKVQAKQMLQRRNHHFLSNPDDGAQSNNPVLTTPDIELQGAVVHQIIKSHRQPTIQLGKFVEVPPHQINRNTNESARSAVVEQDVYRHPAATSIRIEQALLNPWNNMPQKTTQTNTLHAEEDASGEEGACVNNQRHVPAAEKDCTCGALEPESGRTQ